MKVDVQRLREAKDALESVTIVLDQGWSDWHKDACIFLTEHAPALLAGLSELLAIAEAYENAEGVLATVGEDAMGTPVIVAHGFEYGQTVRLVRVVGE